LFVGCALIPVLTMYSLLSRAHSNYLAQINIRMNERQEKTSDILGKLTVLGTIVLPMNVVTGIWGMNWYVKFLRVCSNYG
jgi:magnesium transporter